MFCVHTKEEEQGVNENNINKNEHILAKKQVSSVFTGDNFFFLL